MTEHIGRRPSTRTWTVVAIALAVVALVAVTLAATGQQRAPQPPPAADPGESTTASTAPSSAPSPAPVPAPASESPAAEQVAAPVSVSVPAIGVTSDLLRLGLNDDGTVEVPPLGPDDQAGWYEGGPAPGDVGPAVLLGHVDSAADGPGVFFDLGALEPGDVVDVARADGTVAVFTVDRVERHPKDAFPTIEAYGNTPDAQLRLITCGGDFDSSARSYLDNVIVFATLTSTRPV